MKKETFNLREAYDRLSGIKARLNEMAQNLEDDKEREAFTEAEQAEIRSLEREQSILQSRVSAASIPSVAYAASNHCELNKQIREAISNGQRYELRIPRAVDANFSGNASTYAAGLAGTNPSIITTHDIVEPLWNKTILSAIGSPLLTGLKGNHQWPVVETFAATINDEGAALGDTRIPLSKLVAKPERLGIAVPITREALNETDDLLQVIATQYIPQAMAVLMNKIMFSATKVSQSADIAGPFVALPNTQKATFTGNAPTLADLLGLKSKVLSKNVYADGMCYCMNETMKALLEGTPKWEGSNEAIIVNDRINGVPVFATNEIADNVVDFGAFKYAPQGLFGDMSFIIDPYSQARKNAVDFVLNVDYAITVLRREAFAQLTKSA